jgi:hypothetical protein
MRPVLIALVAVAACGTPSRRLSTRTVDDPMVLPRRLISVGVDASALRMRPAGRTDWTVLPSISYGLGGRLELQDLLSLRYAFLDDAPRSPDEVMADPFARHRMSLAVRAGARGVAVSSIEGLYLAPVVSITAGKHVGQALALFATAEYLGQWVSRPSSFPQRSHFYDENLWPDDRRLREIALGVTAVRQVTDHLALSLSAGGHDLHAGLAPWGSGSRGATGSLGASVRPWHWLSLDASLLGGVRSRPSGPLPPVGPAEPLVTWPPRTVTWLGAAGGVAFRW